LRSNGFTLALSSGLEFDTNRLNLSGFYPEAYSPLFLGTLTAFAKFYCAFGKHSSWIMELQEQILKATNDTIPLNPNGVEIMLTTGHEANIAFN